MLKLKPTLCLGLPVFALLYLFALCGSTLAQTETGFVNRVFSDDAGEHKYVLFIPTGYTPEKKWPVILFLHGAGERGTDGQLQTQIGLGPAIKARPNNFPFIAVFPQCEDTHGRILNGWIADSPDAKRAIQILDGTIKEFSIDQKRQILTGWSMGGYGAWSLAAKSPNRWSAVVPLAGGGNIQWAEKLKNVPVWDFHGSEDAAIHPVQSRQMVEALKSAKANIRYTEIEKVGHDIWKNVYTNPSLIAWMQNPRSTEIDNSKFSSEPDPQIVEIIKSEYPFIPALEIPKAAFIRLGNDSLQIIADSIPKIVPADVLSGKIDDIYDSTTVEGRNFGIQFSEIYYNAKIAQAKLEAYKKNRLNIQVGIENASLTIGETYVSGSGRSAVAGQISVVIGHRRPVWLSIDVTPYVKNRRLKFKLLSTKFDIPNDNWYVTAPNEVWTRGLGMTRQRVSNGLVDGLYGNKQRIESEVKAIVPALLEQLEQKLVFNEMNDLVGKFWPLPVYQPRVQVWADEVATDERGISVVFGMTAAAFTASEAPKTPRIFQPLGLSVDQIPKVTHLQLGVAPQVLNPLTNLLVQADRARIHVLDIPEKTFAELANPQKLAAAFPDLKRFGKDIQIRSELIMKQPLSVVDNSPQTAQASPATTRPASQSQIRLVNGKLPDPKTTSSDQSKKPKKQSTTSQNQFRIDMPELLIAIAVKTPQQPEKWTAYANLEFSLHQPAQVSVLQPNFQTRILKLNWSNNSQIALNAQFAPGYKPKDTTIHQKMLLDMITSSWKNWTQGSPASKSSIPDLDLGFTKLRVSEINWTSPNLVINFKSPGAKITNSSKIPLSYELQGPYSDWGGPYTLEPGKAHEYDVAYPLLYRSSSSGTEELFTLPAGSHSEFREKNPGEPPGLRQARETIPPKTK